MSSQKIQKKNKNNTYHTSNQYPNAVQSQPVTNQDLHIHSNRNRNDTTNNNENQNNNNKHNNNLEEATESTTGINPDSTKHNQQFISTHDFYGDDIDEKEDSALRFIHININNIPESIHAPKNQHLFQAINNSQADIVGMTEVGRCWHLLKEKEKWTERVKKWWENSKSTIAYNTKDVAPTKYQPGGTILCSIGKTCHRTVSSGVDNTGLGRWSWQRFRGKHNVTLRVISAYRPCRAPGPNTVYAQQLRYFDATNETPIQPRKQFFTDLALQIKQWRDNDNDQIVLMMDVNTNSSITTDPELQEFLLSTNLIETITTKHEQQHGLEATHHNGRYPIDGIFVSNTLHPIRCGYLPFGDFPSDHRALWIDIPVNNCFGFNMPNSSKPAARRLKSSDPKIRNKWNRLYSEFLTKHKVHRRIFKLEEHVMAGGTMQMKEQQEYSKIMNLRNQGIQHADKHCRKLTMGNVPFSPDIIATCEKLQMWKGIRTRKTGRKFSLKKIRRLEHKHKVQDAMSYSIKEVENKIVETMKTYKAQKKVAQSLRTSFLQGLADAMAEEKNTEVEKILKQLNTHERQRTSARRIKATLGKLHGGSITKVDIEHGDGSIEEITTKEGIEEACMNENENKYRQTQMSPFMKEPLLSDIGYLGNTKACEDILRGRYTVPEGVNIYTRELIHHMRSLPLNHAPPIAEIPTHTFTAGWKKMKEATSAASVNGLHMGHMKACAQDTFLAEFEAAMVNLPYATGFSPEQWQTGITLMIRKKANVDLVTKLRTIVLTEADFNYCNKVLGKSTLEHAERNNLLPKEQYGSRKGHNSIDQAVHKRLSYDIMRQSRRPGALCSNDAKSCFDRIVHSVAMLAYRRLGMPAPPVQCMLQTIQLMKHHIRTNYGDSVFTMSSKGTLIPYQGILQGNGAAPTTWVIISAPLLEMLRTAGNGGHFISPISKEYSHTVGFAFVDDTDLLHLDMRKQESTNEAMSNMQSAINRWEGGLKATGGTIVNSKSWVYPIAFDFDTRGQWQYKRAEDIEHEFTVKDDRETRQPLSSLNPDVGKETLGVYLAPDGNNNTMVKELRAKAEEWRDNINSGHLNREDAWQALETTIMKSLQYPLKALTLSKAECDSIMQPILQAGLNNASISRNYPRDVAFGSTDEGGLGMEDLYIHQGAERISFITEHLQETSLSAELLRTSIELAKVEIGLGCNLFQLDYAMFQSLLTECWIKDVWKFANEQKILIEDRVTANMQLQRQGDVFIMEEIAHKGSFTPLQLQKINRCRIHMQATTLADITNGYGTRLTTSARQGRKDTTRVSAYNFPFQPRPDQPSIRLWKKALRTCFPLLHEAALIPQLRSWTIPMADTQQWYYLPQNQRLFQKLNNRRYRIWHRTSRAGTLGQYPKFRPHSGTMILPRHCARATVEREQDNTLRLTGWYQEVEEIQKDCRIILPCNDFLEDLDTLDTQSLTSIATAIREGTLNIVSDGSYLDTHRAGTAAWILEAPDGSTTSGRMIIPGAADVQGSYRSELGGLYGAMLHTSLISQRFKISSGKVELGCDGLGAVNIIEKAFKTTKSNMEQFDAIRAINTLRAACTFKIKLRHVKGHQDDAINFYNLDRWAQLNVLVDSMAKQKLTEALAQDEFQHHRCNSFPHDKCSVSFCDDNRFPHTPIQSNLLKAIRRDAGRKRARTYWRKKNSIHVDTEHCIDWKVVHKSHKALDSSNNKWLSKWMTGVCGVGKMMKIYGYQTHSKCPKCQQDNETTDHVLQCQSYGTHCLWQKSMRELRKWIADNDGPEELGDIITQNLNAWRQNSPFPPLPNNRALRNATLQQDSLGWRSFLHGFIGKKWRLAIEQHFIDIRSQKSSTLWMSRLVRKIWDVQRLMWSDRNNTLHGEGNTIHVTEIKAINDEILAQWLEGQNYLPNRYRHLFAGEFRSLYQADYHRKQQWLTSVWLARDRHSLLPIPRNLIANAFYQRWHSRINEPSEPSPQDTAVSDTANNSLAPADPAQETPRTTEPPTATLPCEEPPELDPPPAEPPD